MLPKRTFRVSGISFLVIGLILFLNTVISITGFAILEDVGTSVSSFWALWFIVGGIALIIESRNSQGNLVESTYKGKKTRKANLRKTFS